MAAYGRGDYSGGAYSYGAYLGAFTVESASTVVVTGDKIKDAQFEIYSSSSVSVDSVKIATGIVPIVSTATMTADGGLDAVGNADFVATSVLAIQYYRKRQVEVLITDTSSVSINARKKWETEADVSEIWTTVSV